MNKIKKFFNLFFMMLPFLAIGFSAGLNTSKYINPVYYNSYLMLATVIFFILVRSFITNGKTKLYTQKEYDEKEINPKESQEAKAQELPRKTQAQEKQWQERTPE